MHKKTKIILAAVMAAPAACAADLDYGLELALERTTVDGISLGEDRLADRRVEQGVELELELEYAIGEDSYLFYTGALVSETETLESAGSETDADGVEHRQLGYGLFFGERLQGHFSVGRLDAGADDLWWPWVDDEVDALQLESVYGDVEGRILLSEAQAPDGSAESRIDPEIEDLRVLLIEVDWEFTPGQTIGLDAMRQRDRSSGQQVGQQIDARHEDEIDADLDWAGLAYRGLFEIDDLVEIDVEFYHSRLDGDETVFEFEESDPGRLELDERIRRDVSASARAWRLGFVPARFDTWRLRLGALRASGDEREDDGVNRAFRQSALRGDDERYGALYQPEASNLQMTLLGLDWRVNDRLRIELNRFDYRKRRAAGEAPDNEIDADAEAAGRSLGREINLLVEAELLDDLDLALTAATFDAGNAYGNTASSSASLLSLELDWRF